MDATFHGKDTIATEHFENGENDITESLKEIQNLDSIEETTPGAFVWLCAAAAAIGGLLFGYDTGVISGVLVVIGDDLDSKALSTSEKELITALCAAGALCGAVVAGITADKFGRRPAIWFASILFTLGAIIQATSYTIAQMSVGRFFIGLGVGSASTVCGSCLLSELHLADKYFSLDCSIIHRRNLTVPIQR